MNIIKEMSSTHTTAQIIKKLRKEHSDADILLIAYECGRGTYEAVSSIINKEVVAKYEAEEREVIEDEKDYYE